MQNIVQDAAFKFGVPESEIIGPSKSKTTVKARKQVYKQAHSEGYSLTEIGKFLGGRHHTTVLHGLK
jgi:chromosomal replication initiation ATPase DnaA